MGAKRAGQSLASRVGTWIALLPILALAAVFALAMSPIVLSVLAYAWLKGRALNRQFRREFAARGTPGIVVYSESPNWQERFESEILPRVRPHAVVLNWSERSKWRGRRALPIRVYQHHQPGRNFNPYALIFHPHGEPSRVEFYQAFRDARHGKPHDLERAVDRLYAEIEAAAAAWAIPAQES